MSMSISCFKKNMRKSLRCSVFETIIGSVHCAQCKWDINKNTISKLLWPFSFNWFNIQLTSPASFLRRQLSRSNYSTTFPEVQSLDCLKSWLWHGDGPQNWFSQWKCWRRVQYIEGPGTLSFRLAVWLCNWDWSTEELIYKAESIFHVLRDLWRSLCSGKTRGMSLATVCCSKLPWAFGQAIWLFTCQCPSVCSRCMSIGIRFGWWTSISWPSTSAGRRNRHVETYPAWHICRRGSWTTG